MSQDDRAPPARPIRAEKKPSAPSTERAPDAAREARLAAALRANLRRRKAAQRGASLNEDEK